MTLHQTQLAVIGHPISHSASPRMHMAMIHHLGLTFNYTAIDVAPDTIALFIDRVRRESIRGFNVTIPLKEDIMPFLDEIDPAAKEIGAVNTVVNTNGVLKGFNTDGDGFVVSLEKESKVSIANKKVVILGAGGSSKSIAMACAKRFPTSLHILNRTKDRADSLKAMVESVTDCSVFVSNLSDFKCLEQADLIINTTSLGMVPDVNRSPVNSFSWCHSGQVVYDIIYNPSETLFLKEAKKNGALCQNGSGMLAGQGAIAFKLFTEVEADYILMKHAI